MAQPLVRSLRFWLSRSCNGVSEAVVVTPKETLMRKLGLQGLAMLSVQQRVRLIKDSLSSGRATLKSPEALHLYYQLLANQCALCCIRTAVQHPPAAAND